MNSTGNVVLYEGNTKNETGEQYEGKFVHCFLLKPVRELDKAESA